jgi:hypothetical protein
VTTAFSDPVGKTNETFVVEPPLTETDWFGALNAPLAAVTVYPEPSGRPVNVATPLAFVVAVAVGTERGPAATVTVAPATGPPPDVTVAAIVPRASAVTVAVASRSLG